MSGALPYVLGVLVAAATTLGTYLVARRTKSGQAGDTDADKLWDESTLLRTELRNEVVELRNEVRTLRLELVAERLARVEQADLIAALTRQVADLQAHIKAVGAPRARAVKRAKPSARKAG